MTTVVRQRLSAQLLTEDRAVIVATLNRGILHLVRREDCPWLHALTAPTVGTGDARRLAQEGVTPAAAARAVEVMVRALGEHGPPGAIPCDYWLPRWAPRLGDRRSRTSCCSQLCAGILSAARVPAIDPPSF